jgi:hypothetical protein
LTDGDKGCASVLGSDAEYDLINDWLGCFPGEKGYRWQLFGVAGVGTSAVEGSPYPRQVQRSRGTSCTNKNNTVNFSNMASFDNKIVLRILLLLPVSRIADFLDSGARGRFSVCGPALVL